MNFLKRLWAIFSEMPAYASIVCESYGSNKFRWMLDMAWALIRYGALPIDYVRFEFHKKSARERNRYLTYYRYTPLFKYLNKVLGNVTCCKSREYSLFSNMIKREWIYVDANTPQEEILNFIDKHDTVIAKPDYGEQGHGILKLNKGDSKTLQQLLKNRIKIPYVVEEWLVNIPEIDKINPSSLNTIRCYTFIDKEGKSHIMEMMLRVGRSGSHVDNWGSGGIGYCFDIETGICSQYGLDKLNKTYAFHPESNAQMIGFRLPHFDDLKSYVFKLVKVVPEARFVGWDIAITPAGFDLVEMNCPGGHDFLQAFGRPWGDFMKKNW